MNEAISASESNFSLQRISEIDIRDSENVIITQKQIIQISVDEIKTREFIENSPYKGLKKFESGDKDLFFGREQLLAELVNDLEKHSLILLLGASGSGKSSVVRAGIVPWFARKYGAKSILTFTPGQNPFKSLYACLLTNEYSIEDEEDEIVKYSKINTLFEVVKKLKPKDANWLIFIDQFEQIFTRTPEEKRKLFLESLVRLIKQQDKSVKLIMTMRADFFDRFTPYPKLSKLTEKRIRYVADMDEHELRLAIEQPAAQHGVVFEKGLVEEIIKEVQGRPGYLPLLQYTLNLLWETERESGGLEDRTLNSSTYRQLGGVIGALNKHVENIYTQLDKEGRGEDVKQVFLRLVDIAKTEDSGVIGKPVSRQAYRSEFRGNVQLENTLQELIDQNLLVSNDVELDKQSTVEIAHEALLTSWETLKEWVKEAHEVIVLRNRLAEDLKQWRKTKAKNDFLQGSRLEKIVELRKDKAFDILGGLKNEENQFIDDSIESRDSQRRRTILGLTMFSAIALILAGLAGWQWLQAERQTKKVQLQRDIALANNLLSKEPTRAAVLSIYATGQSVAGYKDILISAESSLLTSVQGAREKNLFKGHQGEVLSVAISPDGQKIVSAGADGTVRLVNLTNFSQQVVEDFQGVEATSVAFNRNGKFLASADVNGEIKIRQVQDNSLVCDYQGYPKESNFYRTVLAFNPQKENLLISAGPDNKVRLLNVENCNEQILATLESKDQDVKIYPSVTAIAFGSKGNRLAIGDEAAGLTLLNLPTKTTQTLLKADPGFAESIQSLAFDSVNEQIIFGIGIHEQSESSSIGVIENRPQENQGKWTERWIEVQEFNVYQNFASGIAFHSKTDQIVSSGDERGDSRNLILFNSRTGNILFAFIGHKGMVNALALSQDNQNLVSAGSDSTVRLWSMESLPKDVASLFQQQSSNQLDFWDFFGRKLKLHRRGNAIEIEAESQGEIDTDIKETPILLDQEYPKFFYSYDGNSVAVVKAESEGSKGKETNSQVKKNLIHIKARQTNAQLGEFEVNGEVISVSISNTHDKVIIVKPDKIEIRDFQGKRLPLASPLVNDGQINVAAISPDGRMFVTAKGDFSITGDPRPRRPPLQLFDMQGQLIGKFEQEGQVDFLAFSPDSRYIITRKYGEIHFFPANWQASLEILCNRLRHHPILNDPETLAQDESAKGARETCQKYSPSWQTN